MEDLLKQIDFDLSNFIDFLEDSKPKVFYRKYRFKNKFKKSKKMFIKNDLIDYIIDSSCLFLPLAHDLIKNRM